ncbi:hypothetical protein Sango_0807200 [Sesamum angolense]|uniref:Endonuclease/exonuclease/phosphatase domain-containing protein n=1 Tax=Sesamum angolense TaxID=2727404 RepID=A0AAE1X3D6_9LAMI|nr:hypothetical protein Sango_0807200 [Sesamum angolense]
MDKVDSGSIIVEEATDPPTLPTDQATISVEQQATSLKPIEKGKELAVYNPFDVLLFDADDAESFERGYGANDGVLRRELWQHLRLLARLITNDPWIVGGDFNTVLDMNKVCGASSDIHVAMHEFQDCINETGLIHLPMQGELFTWHNCSEGNRSLWKRLDHFLVTDD